MIVRPMASLGLKRIAVMRRNCNANNQTVHMPGQPCHHELPRQRQGLRRQYPSVADRRNWEEETEWIDAATLSTASCLELS